jgi:hypothetical protein
MMKIDPKCIISDRSLCKGKTVADAAVTTASGHVLGAGYELPFMPRVSFPNKLVALKVEGSSFLQAWDEGGFFRFGTHTEPSMQWKLLCDGPYVVAEHSPSWWLLTRMLQCHSGEAFMWPLDDEHYLLLPESRNYRTVGNCKLLLAWVILIVCCHI